jgi:hypothetical protein
MIRKTEQKLTYPISLLLSTDNRKTCESISKIAKKSGDLFCRLLKNQTITKEDLIALIQKIFGNRKLTLILDDTIIAKLYSKIIEGACDNYDSGDRRSYRSLCSIVAVVTDGQHAIPIDQSLWISSEFIGDNSYKKKHEIAFEMIQKLLPLISIQKLVADGLYATKVMLEKCIEAGIFFEMRFHSNRVIECHGEKAPIREIQKLQLKGKAKARTKKGIWYELQLYFTSVKKISKTGRVIITYQVSNYTAFAQQHVQAYEYRWAIEKFFRTAKQHLGLNDCQAQTRKAQESHIFYVFFAYALAQIEKIQKRLKTPEQAIRLFKRKKYDNLIQYFSRSRQIFGDVYA